MEPKGLLTISPITACLASHQGGFFSQEIGYVCAHVFFLLSYMMHGVHGVMLHLCLTGIPDCSEEDWSVARALNLRWTTVLKSDKDGMQTLINSDEVRTVDDEHSIDEMKMTHDY